MMGLFDSITGEIGEKLGLGDKAGSLVTALLTMITTGNEGGFSGFLNRFKEAGLGDIADSWVSDGANEPLSNEQTESVFGADALKEVSEKVGLDYETTTTATSAIVPQIVDKLTPNGEVPDEGSLMSMISGLIPGIGGAVTGAAAAAVGAASAGKDALSGGISAVGDKVGGTIDSFSDNLDGGGSSVLKWLLPLILLAILVGAGYMFCGKPTAPTVANTNTNANKATPTNTNSAPKTASSATPDAERKLGEVSLPDGTKLQAYPGGIEDQLIKFIESNEFKNGTNDSLKDKWFNFDDLNFKLGSTELAPESKRQLDNIVAILKAFPDAKIKIGGYTDKTGDDAANKKLSDSRAKAVKAALEKAGVGAQAPEAEGYGEEFAKVPETASDEERKADRKTAVRLIK